LKDIDWTGLVDDDGLSSVTRMGMVSQFSSPNNLLNSISVALTRLCKFTSTQVLAEKQYPVLMNVLSRQYEFQADDFAKKLGYNADLAKSLIKLQIQNLSTMDADWMYASYHFSHPILSERLGALGWTSDVRVTDVTESEKDGEVVKASGRDEL